jgi:hypothetical protein
MVATKIFDVACRLLQIGVVGETTRKTIAESYPRHAAAGKEFAENIRVQRTRWQSHQRRTLDARFGLETHNTKPEQCRDTGGDKTINFAFSTTGSVHRRNHRCEIYAD